jgi:hypothetical protein
MVMEISQRVTGAEHPDTLTSMSDLALTYSNQGKWKEAEELDAMEMEISRREPLQSFFDNKNVPPQKYALMYYVHLAEIS